MNTENNTRLLVDEIASTVNQTNLQLRQVLKGAGECDVVPAADTLLNTVKVKLTGYEKQIAALPHAERAKVEPVHAGAMTWLTKETDKQAQRRAGARALALAQA